MNIHINKILSINIVPLVDIRSVIEQWTMADADADNVGDGVLLMLVLPGNLCW